MREFIFLFVMVAFYTSEAVPPSSCLKVFNIQNESYFSNPGLVMVDSCESSPTYLKYFAKEYFYIELKYNIIPRNYVTSQNSVIEYSLESIQAKNPIAKSEFERLRKLYGNFSFKEIKPNNPDTTRFLSREFLIKFDSYQDINQVVETLKSFSSIKSAKFNDWFNFVSYIPDDNQFVRGISYTDMTGSPYPSSNEWYPKNCHKRGWAWNHYSSKLPLAWDISKGKSSIFVGASESLDNNYTHLDLVNNFYQITALNQGDGDVLTSNMKDGHGLATLSCVIADDNNGYPLVGSCPDCKGFYTDSPENFTRIDVDGTVGNGITVPQVVYECVGYMHDPLNLIQSGIVALGAAGNSLGLSVFNSNNILYPRSSPWHMYEAFPCPDYPTDRTKDLKVISVGGLADGTYHDRNCNYWQFDPNVRGSNWQGPERFISYPVYNSGTPAGAVFNFSRGNSKFDNDIAVKNSAYVDVVIPATDILNATGTDYFYHMGSGTSQGVAIVGGIVGLMRSINTTLSQNPTNGNQSVLYNIQKTAYDILTFTAKKVLDDGMIPDIAGTQDNPGTQYPVAKHYLSGSNTNLSWQYDYVTQLNDVLKRSWAQRMGFGLVDAYRAAAHSIRQKGQYLYNLPANTTLQILPADINSDPRGYVNPSGKRIMHWGSKIKEGTGAFEMSIDRGPTPANDGILNVLEWGGISLPGEFHNNQGVTKINHTANTNRLELIVPEGSILAIDGILTTDQPLLSHYVVTGGGFGNTNNGKILMEGYLKDVEICGNLSIGDLTVVSTTNSGLAGISGAVGFGNVAPSISDVYGKVILKDYAKLYSWGQARFLPGTYIDMQGSEDITLNFGSHTYLEFGSTVTGIAGRKIVVKNGAELSVETNANVELLCEVLVEGGGRFIVNSNSVVKINKLTIEKDADLQIFHGSVVALKEPEQFWNGRVTITGVPDNKVEIVGMLEETCLPDDDPQYTDFEHIYTTPVIYMKGACNVNDLGKTHLNMVNTRFKNISLETHDVSIASPILNCEFLTATRLTNPYLNFPYLLSLNYNKCQQCEFEDFTSVTLDNCLFEDVSGVEFHPTEPGNYNENIYRTGGLVVEGYHEATIKNSNFNNLEYGVSTYDCGDVKIQNSSFISCGIGDYDFQSNTLLCDNFYEYVRFGSVRDHSLIGKAFDNQYKFNRIGFGAVSSGRQFFRSNKFTDYLLGISSSCSDLWLASLEENVYGSNVFVTTPIPTDPDDFENYLNKFITKTCEISSSTDINLNKNCCMLYLHYGHNMFSEGATYHIKYTGTGGFPSVSINSNAMMPAPYTPRVYGLSVTGSNLSEDEYVELYPICDEITREPLGDDDLMIDFPIDSDLNNPAAKYDLSSMIKEGLAIQDIKSLYQAIDLYGKSDIRSTSEIIDKEVKGMNSDIDVNFRDEIEILKADIALKTGEKEKALGILSGLDESKGGILRIKSGEKIQGATGSGLLAVVAKSLDFSCNEAATETKDALPGLVLTLEQNYPNPFSNLTDIGFTLANQSNISIVVTDLYGNKISNLITNVLYPAGRHKVPFNTDGISSGVYVYTLYADGVALSKKMHVVK